MGSRLNIALQDVLNYPEIQVRLYAHEMNDGEDNPGGHNTVETCAELTFRSNEQEDFVVVFDYSAHAGAVTLSLDFNWFRYPNDPDHVSRKLLRALYNHSISFTVHH
jgi:hypothetical protein